MKARIFTLIALICLAMPTFGWAKPQETIVFWYGATHDEKAAYEKMVADFERANPDIKVNAMLVPQSYIERKLILSVAGGVPPDVVRFYAHLGGELMSRGGLEPLDDLIAQDHYNLKDFFKVGLDQNRYQGKLYGIPWILSPNALFYNKKAFRDAGLDPNKPPKNWAELKSYAMKLTRKDAKGNLERIGFADFLYNPNNFTLYMWQLGGELISADGHRPTFNGPQGIAALTWMKNFLIEEAGSVENLLKFSANFKGAVQDPFGQGVVAMRIDTPFRIPDLKKNFPNLDYGITQVPYAKQAAIEVVGNSLVIPKGSAHREAAWKFIKFASSNAQISSICGVAGRVPARISAAKSPRFYGNPQMRSFVDLIPTGKSIPIVPGWKEVADNLSRSIPLALKGKMSPQDALNTSARESEKILSRATEDMSAFPEVPWTTLGILGGALLLGICAWMVIYVRRNTAHSKMERQEAGQFFLFAAPWIIGFIVFTFGASLASLIISFSKWDALNPAHYVGLRNYSDLFLNDPRFYKALWVTFYYAIFSIPLAIIGGLGVSILLNQKIFGIRIFRTVYYLPVVISGVATSVLWQWVFNPNGGLLNKFLMMNVIPTFAHGILVWQPLWASPPGWILDPAWTVPAFIIMGFWGVGGAMIVYLAALQGVPEELYEAARLDGASPWKVFRHVTLPMLSPAIFYQLIVGTMYALQMFTQVYIMTGGTGGQEDSALFYALYLFKNAFEFMKIGYASAMAWILFIVVLIITLIHFKGASRWVYYEGSKE
ncbi:MAG: extracellular solute-binding protein [Armatimonadetes bacterium]|nr:extracellular solute-binding protein [Armatimonadota bacterium]